MMNLMKADIYRIAKGKGIYIAFAILLILAVFTVLVFRAAPTGPVAVSEGGEDVVTGAVAAQFALNNVADNIIHFFIAAAVMAVMAGFSSGAIRNEISIGTSRTKIYLARWLLAIGLGFIFMLANVLLHMVIALPLDGAGNFSAGLFQSFALQLAIMVAYVSVLVFLAFTTKKTAVVITLILIFTFVPVGTVSMLSDAYPRLMQFQYYDLVSQFYFFAGEASGVQIARGLVLAGGYVLVTTLGGIVLFSRCEVK